MEEKGEYRNDLSNQIEEYDSFCFDETDETQDFEIRSQLKQLDTLIKKSTNIAKSCTPVKRKIPNSEKMYPNKHMKQTEQQKTPEHWLSSNKFVLFIYFLGVLSGIAACYAALRVIGSSCIDMNSHLYDNKDGGVCKEP